MKTNSETNDMPSTEQVDGLPNGPQDSTIDIGVDFRFWRLRRQERARAARRPRDVDAQERHLIGSVMPLVW